VTNSKGSGRDLMASCPAPTAAGRSGSKRQRAVPTGLQKKRGGTRGRKEAAHAGRPKKNAGREGESGGGAGGGGSGGARDAGGDGK
jgi:hypothetical protein